jgi:hypothetical protein
VKTKRVVIVTLITMMMLLALSASMVAADSGSGDPEPARVQSWSSYTFYNAAIVTTGTLNTASPLIRAGIDASRAVQWANADVFVTAAVSGTAVLTVTPQFSNDAVNWASAYWNTVSSTTVTAQPYRIVLSANGSSYLRMPMAGEYVRFNIANTGYVTATVRVTFKNYQ